MSFSIACFTAWICGLSAEPSAATMEHAMTGRETPQARPSATLDGTNTYGTFCGARAHTRAREMTA